MNECIALMMYIMIIIAAVAAGIAIATAGDQRAIYQDLII
jgi:hypothetical protein